MYNINSNFCDLFKGIIQNFNRMKIDRTQFKIQSITDTQKFKGNDKQGSHK